MHGLVWVCLCMYCMCCFAFVRGCVVGGYECMYVLMDVYGTMMAYIYIYMYCMCSVYDVGTG